MRPLAPPAQAIAAEAVDPLPFGERFLTCPDLFPARRSGESWGERRLVLDLPGGPYLAAGLSAGQEEGVRQRFGEACRAAAGGGAPDVAVFRADRGDFREVDTRGWSYALDFDYGEAAVRLAGLRLMARLDSQAALTAALWTSEEGDRFPGIFENLLRVLVAYRLVAAGGALLHAAGVADGRGAVLFLGASGAGKSTLSGLSAQAGKTVLSDDLNAALPGAAGGARVERVPFTGDFEAAGAPGSWPLRALLRIEKGPADTIVPLGLAAGLATLLACSPFVNADPHRRDRLAANLEELARRVPRGVLTFSLGGGFWRILDASLP
jgi:hypothetical protein